MELENSMLRPTVHDDRYDSYGSLCDTCIHADNCYMAEYEISNCDEYEEE